MMKMGMLVDAIILIAEKNLEIDWSERQEILKEITDKVAKFEAKKRGNSRNR